MYNTSPVLEEWNGTDVNLQTNNRCWQQYFVHFFHFCSLHIFCLPSLAFTVTYCEQTRSYKDEVSWTDRWLTRRSGLVTHCAALAALHGATKKRWKPPEWLIIKWPLTAADCLNLKCLGKQEVKAWERQCNNQREQAERVVCHCPLLKFLHNPNISD